MVPFLYFLLEGSGWSGLQALPEHHATLAHATSLAVILPTALSGILAHRRHGVADWAVILPLGLGAAAGAVLGAAVAVATPSVVLKALFGGFLLVMAWRLGVPGARLAPVGDDQEPTMRWSWALGGGVVVGWFSALLGVGGGIVAIPILLRWTRMDLHRVTAASLGVIAFAAVAGIAGYALLGRGVPGLPAGAVGFVHIPLFFCMLPGAVALAPLGAALNNRLPVAVLRRVFAVLFLLLGSRLVWLHGGEVLSRVVG